MGGHETQKKKKMNTAQPKRSDNIVHRTVEEYIDETNALADIINNLYSHNV